jgi:ribosome biogenesis GTPase
MTTSVATGEGVSTVRDALEKGKTYGFLGSSGVGKSSLINRLLETDGIRTGAIGSHSERGKHVTTAREMYFLGNGGIVIDNPGMREVGLTDTETGIEESFDEIASLSEKCRFADCTHEHEPGCAVLAALESGTIDRDKYDNYLRLRKEADFFGLTAVQKRSKDRQFGKFIDTAKKGLKKYGQKGKGK